MKRFSQYTLFVIATVFFVASWTTADAKPLTLEEFEKEVKEKENWDTAGPNGELVVGLDCFRTEAQGLKYRIVFLRFFPILFSGADVSEKNVLKSEGEITLTYHTKWEQDEYTVVCNPSGVCKAEYYQAVHEQRYGYVININPREGAYFVLLLGKNENFRPFDEKESKIYPLNKEQWKKYCGDVFPEKTDEFK